MTIWDVKATSWACAAGAAARARPKAATPRPASALSGLVMGSPLRRALFRGSRGGRPGGGRARQLLRIPVLVGLAVDEPPGVEPGGGVGVALGVLQVTHGHHRHVVVFGCYGHH